jgi:hypothetical protein
VNGRRLILIASLTCFASLSPAAAPPSWQKVSSTHFIVLHLDDELLAKTVSERAESYYSSIAADLGYTRYQNFWLWDNRVKILIYPTAAAFSEACDAPAWAAGRASPQRHEIASYRQSGEGFLSALLPHELAHLILSDFMGESHVPLWLTEGFSEWVQGGRKSPASGSQISRRFPLKTLFTMDIRRDTDQERISLFYAQSASVVGFLIKTYGGESFGSFCRALRDGKNLAAALAAAYPHDVPSLDILEQKWLTPRTPGR